MEAFCFEQDSRLGFACGAPHHNVNRPAPPRQLESLKPESDGYWETQAVEERGLPLREPDERARRVSSLQVALPPPRDINSVDAAAIAAIWKGRELYKLLAARPPERPAHEPIVEAVIYLRALGSAGRQRHSQSPPLFLRLWQCVEVINGPESLEKRNH